ncbi:MAG: hypothetical protein LKF53_02805 [Solobacterium sp.]|nr:hypothetical protein [Solobacterium sp.]MCH4205309.1 hypothetical protein [Solobacterium sp.]MCH4226902.1 hypothetical protein [Solobacterium sp.]MCH4281662.1 hypothetical protein [Solobacterium sp.]
MKDFYSASELATEWHCSIHRIWDLNRYGLLHGIKFGKGYVYSKETIQECFEKYRGYDLGNIEKIRIAKQLETKKEHQSRQTVSAR